MIKKYCMSCFKREAVKRVTGNRVICEQCYEQMKKNTKGKK